MEEELKVGLKGGGGAKGGSYRWSLKVEVELVGGA